MTDDDKYIDLIKGRLSEYRFYHSMCVAKSAKELAKRFGADENKAYTAGILHDVMKECTKSEQREVIEKAGMKMTELEKNNKKLYHQMSGAAFVQLELKISDSDIINAIRYHTTARRNMSLLEQVIYLADFISDDRDYDDVDIMRSEVLKGKNQGMLYAMRYTICDLAQNKKPIHPDTVDAYNWVIEEYERKTVNGNT